MICVRGGLRLLGMDSNAVLPFKGKILCFLLKILRSNNIKLFKILVCCRVFYLQQLFTQLKRSLSVAWHSAVGTFWHGFRIQQGFVFIICTCILLSNNNIKLFIILVCCRVFYLQQLFTQLKRSLSVAWHSAIGTQLAWLVLSDMVAEFNRVSYTIKPSDKCTDIGVA